MISCGYFVSPDNDCEVIKALPGNLKRFPVRYQILIKPVPMLKYSPLLFIPLLLLSCGNNPAVPEIPEVPENQYPAQREVWQQPGYVVDAMGELEEKVVADIGAGRGFLVPYVAPYCDRMIAIEIDPKLVDYLQDTLRPAILPANQQTRLEARLTTPESSGLKDEEADVILMVNTLSYIQQQQRYLTNLFPKLKEGGRIVIVDWKDQKTPYGPSLSQRISVPDLRKMLTEAGFKVIRADDGTLDYQYLLVAEK